MRHRCTNPNATNFDDYGGRGIRVCDRWRESFENFVADVGPRPTPKHMLERIDNERGYEPNNVRWATRTEQMRNRRSSRLLTHAGETLPLAAWAERLGITSGALLARIDHHGWTVADAVTTPPLSPGERYRANSRGRPANARQKVTAIIDGGDASKLPLVAGRTYRVVIEEL